MAIDINTDEIRRVAREIKEIAGSAKQLSTSNVRNMRNCVEENLEGETAKALKEVLGDLSNDINSISSGLDTIQKALFKYADRVDEADREAERRISGK